MTALTDKAQLERAFDTYWGILAPGFDVPEKEVRFHPTRRWRFDRAWVKQKVAVEIDGGVFIRGRHTRGMGYHRQIEKQNQAQVCGWAVLRYDTKHIHEDPQAMVDEIVQLLAERS